MGSMARYKILIYTAFYWRKARRCQRNTLPLSIGDSGSYLMLDLAGLAIAALVLLFGLRSDNDEWLN